MLCSFVTSTTNKLRQQFTQDKAETTCTRSRIVKENVVWTRDHWPYDPSHKKSHRKAFRRLRLIIRDNLRNLGNAPTNNTDQSKQQSNFILCTTDTIFQVNLSPLQTTPVHRASRWRSSMKKSHYGETDILLTWNNFRKKKNCRSTFNNTYA